MALTSLLQSFTTALNANPGAIVADMNTFFAANTNIIVKGIDSSSPFSSYSSNLIKIRLAYQQVTVENTGITYQADLYTSDITSGTLTAQDKFNNDHSVNNVCLVPLFFLDITEHERNRTAPQQILVISGDTSAAGSDTLFAIDRGVFVAQPINNIAAGATGNAIIINACGSIVSNSFPVTNVDPASVWVADERNYVTFDPVTGELIGLPSCCGTAALGVPVGPTTPPTDCITVEVQSFTPASSTSSTTQPPAL